MDAPDPVLGGVVHPYSVRVRADEEVSAFVILLEGCDCRLLFHQFHSRHSQRPFRTQVIYVQSAYCRRYPQQVPAVPEYVFDVKGTKPDIDLLRPGPVHFQGLFVYEISSVLGSRRYYRVTAALVNLDNVRNVLGGFRDFRIPEVEETECAVVLVEELQPPRRAYPVVARTVFKHAQHAAAGDPVFIFPVI